MAWTVIWNSDAMAMVELEALDLAQGEGRRGVLLNPTHRCYMAMVLTGMKDMTV